MEKVFIVRYYNEKLDYFGIWGLYSNANKAEIAVQYIKANYGHQAWWSEEVVQ